MDSDLLIDHQRSPDEMTVKEPVTQVLDQCSSEMFHCRTHYLAEKSSPYDDMGAQNVAKWSKRLQVHMRSKIFHSLDTIPILSFHLLSNVPVI